MKKIISFILVLCAINISFAQVLVQLPSGGNKKAMEGEQIGITKIVIHYDRPGVKGREEKFMALLSTKALKILVMVQVKLLHGERAVMKIQP
jgi:hypothetical protein